MSNLEYQRKLSRKLEELKSVELLIKVASSMGNDIDYIKLDRRRAELEIQIECELALGAIQSGGGIEVMSIPRNLGLNK